MATFKSKMIFGAVALVAILGAGLGGFEYFRLSGPTSSEEVGSVSTEFKLFGADSKVVVEVFDDPLVHGVSCYISRAKTGGASGSLGMAEDTSDASVACRQMDDISFSGPLPKRGEVFSQSSSPMFKRVRVERMVDQKRNALIYLVYSDKLVDGSPKNSVTAVSVPKATRIPIKG